MEGRPSFTLPDDPLYDYIDFLEHIARSDAHNAIAMPLQIGLAKAIDPRLHSVLVRLSVHLNQEPC